MSQPNPFYADGYFSPDQEVSVLPNLAYPFALRPTPDRYSLVESRAYNVLPKRYAPRIANRTSWTNLLTSSEVFTAVWSANAVTPTDNVTTAPDGNTTLAQLIETAANAEHSVSRSLTLTAAPSTVSIFAVGGLNRSWIRIKFVDSAAATFTAFFNIESGAVGSLSAGVTASIVPMPNGGFRCIATFTPAAGAGTITFNISTNGTTVSYAGDTAKGVYIWGAEAKTASFAGPYIGTTSTTRTVLAPDQDITINLSANAQDPLAYLVDETDPIWVTSAFGDVRRKFARIPKQQVQGSTMAITKPSAPNQSTGTLTFYKQDASADSVAGIGTGAYYNNYLFPGNNEVYGPLRSVVYTVQTVATGGTFTVTYKSSTTAALAYNATTLSVAAAINALASVVSDGLTVSVNGGAGNMWNASVSRSLSVTVGSTTSRFTIDAALLTGVSVPKAFTNIASSTVQDFWLATKYSIVAHGLDAASYLSFASQTVATASTNSMIIRPVTAWSVVDANTIAVIPSLGGTFASGLYQTGASVSTKLRNYTPGPDRVGIKLVQDFYLPGVTPGISTFTDIPIPSPLINDAEFLAAVVSNLTGYLNYDADPLVEWMGPIYTQTQKQINMADV